MARINNTYPPEEPRSSVGFLLGVLLIILVVFMFVVYGLPTLQTQLGNQPQTPGIGGGPPAMNILRNTSPIPGK